MHVMSHRCLQPRSDLMVSLTLWPSHQEPQEFRPADIAAADLRGGRGRDEAQEGTALVKGGAGLSHRQMPHVPYACYPGCAGRW